MSEKSRRRPSIEEVWFSIIGSPGELKDVIKPESG
jgi:hypothetical protein